MGVDPLVIPADRLINLIYFRLCDGLDEEHRRELDGSLDRAAQAGTVSTSRPARNEDGTVDRRSLPPPSWWKGDDHASMMAEMFGKSGPPVQGGVQG